jgi:propanol-preferring alcohol dehydrogenase
MRAMVLAGAGRPLELRDVPVRAIGAGEILLRVHACGVCRTDLHVVDGDLTQPKPNVVPGHEIVGTVEALGPGATGFVTGDRVGVPWLGWTCGACRFCMSGRENLCDRAHFTGYTLDGGYAEHVVADARYCFKLPAGYSDAEAAPLLCAGLIGYRALKMAGAARTIGMYGFGAAAHIAVQAAMHRGQTTFAFTRPDDTAGQAFARSLGATWAGGSDQRPPKELDAAIIFAPVGALVPAALAATMKGGSVICAGIHMSDIPSFPYELLWGERSVRSVANLTRADGEEFLALAGAAKIRTTVTTFPLPEANTALNRLRDGEIEGAAVLMP